MLKNMQIQIVKVLAFYYKKYIFVEAK